MQQTSKEIFPTSMRYLREIIDGLIEGILLLNAKGHITWANDTALAMHGVSLLADLGGTEAGYRKRYGLRYRNQRKLQPSQYPMRRAMEGDVFKDMTVEVTRLRDADFLKVHQVRSLILRDDQDEPECIALVLLDVTERYSAEDRFETAFHAKPAPALICSLADLRYIKVNQGFLQMTGYARHEVIGQSVLEVDVLGNTPQREEAELRLKEGKTIPQMETCIPIPGGNKLVVVAGQPIEIDDEACMMFSFNDLEARRRAEEALRYSEARFSAAFRLAPVPMLLCTQDGRPLEINDAFVQTTGYQLDMLVSAPDALSLIWHEPQRYRQGMTRLAEGKGLRNQELTLRTAQGQLLDCLVSADPVVIQEEHCVLGVIQDITDRKRTETELMAAIEAVMQDTSWFSQTVIEKLAQIRQPPTVAMADAELADLTPREREVLGLMCEGLGDQEIARRLSLSRNTIRNHVASLYSKLHVHRRSAAIIWARERGIVGHDKPAIGARGNQ